MEVDDKVQGLRFIKKCSITDEITAQIRIYPHEDKSPDGEVQLHIDNMRYPREGIRVGVKSVYRFTEELTIAEKHG